MEDYLKAIYELSSSGARVSTSRLARRMNCTPASVTNMLQKLSSILLVEYEPYRGVALTEAGSKIALEVIRHHRLIELYLAEVLGYSWDQVHEEADQLEHVISEEFEKRIDKALGYPRWDPHGAPIPTRDGDIHESELLTLWEVEPGARIEIREVDDKNSDLLRYLASLGVLPGVEIKVVEKAPFGGPLEVVVEGVRHGLSEKLARRVLVRVQ